MTAERQDFELYEGESKQITVDETADEDSGGTLDMSGFQELRWYALTHENGTSLIDKTDSDSDVSVTDVSVGAYTITIQPSETEDVIPSVKTEEEYPHYVQLTDSSGRTSFLLQGTMTVKPS